MALCFAAAHSHHCCCPCSELWKRPWLSSTSLFSDDACFRIMNRWNFTERSCRGTVRRRSPQNGFCLMTMLNGRRLTRVRPVMHRAMDLLFLTIKSNIGFTTNLPSVFSLPIQGHLLKAFSLLEKIFATATAGQRSLNRYIPTTKRVGDHNHPVISASSSPLPLFSLSISCRFPSFPLLLLCD